MVSTTVSKYVDVEIDVELSDFDTEDLIEELEVRGINVPDEDVIGQKSPTNLQIEELYIAYTLKQTDKVDELLRELFYDTLGRIA